MSTNLDHISAIRPLQCALAAGLLLAATHLQAQERPGHGAMDPRIDQFVTTQDSASGFGGVVPADATELNDADRAFLREVHQLELFQVHASIVALKRRKAGPEIHSHARRVLDSHQASLVAIEKFARVHGVELERRFRPEFEERAVALRKAGRSSFGAVYFGQMLEIHEHTLARYDAASTSIDDAELLSLVDDSLPTLRTQLANAAQFTTTVGTPATH